MTNSDPGILDAELRENLIEAICESLAKHQVKVDGFLDRCNCGKRIYSGEEGSMTLLRHRAEKIVDDILTAQLVSAPFSR